MSKDYTRRSNGQFGPGNDGGGRVGKNIITFNEMAARAVTEEDWLKIINLAKADAQHKNPGVRQRAREWLADRQFGKVAQTLNIRTATDYEVLLPGEDEESIIDDDPSRTLVLSSGDAESAGDNTSEEIKNPLRFDGDD